jgi:hypothetical protein
MKKFLKSKIETLYAIAFVLIFFAFSYILIKINNATRIDPGIFFISLSFIFVGICAGTLNDIKHYIRIIQIPKPSYYNDDRFKSIIQFISGFLGLISYSCLSIAYDMKIIGLITVLYWLIFREISIFLGYKIISTISFLYGIINNEHLSLKSVYKIGNRGPAGGFVFFDKGNYSSGWRYLEAAVKDQGRSKWGCYDKSISKKKMTSIGTGKINTQLISHHCLDGNIAAKLCISYKGGGKSDWFLPSLGELSLMYNNLQKSGIGGFSGDYYWSSSESSSISSWCKRFRFTQVIDDSNVDKYLDDDDDGFDNCVGAKVLYNKDQLAYVRAIRSF